METDSLFRAIALFAVGGCISAMAAATPPDAESRLGNAPWRNTPQAYRPVAPPAGEPRGGSATAIPAEHTTPDAFLRMLSEGKVMPKYDAVRLRKLVDQYNLSQHKRFGIEPAKAEPNDFVDAFDERPKGYTQLKLADWGKHFVIYVETVDETHTDMIDGGQDSYASVFFTKRPVEQVLDVPGPTLPLANTGLVLSIPQTYSCMGDVPTGELSVHNLRSGPVFTASLPPGTLALELYEPTGNTVRFKTRSEEPSSKAGKRKYHCDVGSWVKKIDTTFSLTCNPAKGQCTMRRIDRQVSEGCQDIGGCD